MKKFDFDDFKVPNKLEGDYTIYIEFAFLINGSFKKECWKKRGAISNF